MSFTIRLLPHDDGSGDVTILEQGEFGAIRVLVESCSREQLAELGKAIIDALAGGS